MFSALIFVVVTVLLLLLIDSYSVLLSFFACIIAVYFYIYKFSYIFNQHVIVSLITRIWVFLLRLFRFSQYVFCFFRRLFLSASTSAPARCNSNARFCGHVPCLETEVNTLVLNISKSYIKSWYGRISGNEEFTLHLNCSINDALLSLCDTVTKVDKKKLSFVLLHVYLNFFFHFVEAKKKSDIFKKDNFQMKHWAMKDKFTEWCYLQSLFSSLLDTFGPTETKRSLHSKYSPLLHNIVVEILTANLICPLVNLLSDPSHLNKLLLKILSNNVAVNGRSYTFSDSKCQNAESITSDEHGHSHPKILLSKEDSLDDVFERKSEAASRYSIPSDSSKIHTSSPYSSQHSDKELSKGLPSFISSGIKSSSNLNLSKFDFSEWNILDNNRQSASDDSIIKRSKSADFIRQMPQLKALNEKDYDILPCENNKMLIALKSDVSSGAIEQAEEAIEIEVPTLFSDVKITDTTLQNESGILPYTLYGIQYTGIFHDTAKSSDIPQFVKQVVNVKRRFREFVALQSKLEDNPLLKSCLKGIKGPSKWLVLPFSNLDKKHIAERKIFLENYLKELCNVATISQCSEFQEFLAYGGDDRDRKTSEANVTRIDKILTRSVKGAFDIFRTALPNSPSDEENMSPSTRLTLEDIIPEQRFQEHHLDYSSREPEISKLLKNFIDRLSSDQKSRESTSKKVMLPKPCQNFKVTKTCKCPILSETTLLQKESAFGDVLIEIIAIALKMSETNLGEIFSIFKLLCAPCIDRYILDKINEVSDQHLITLLHMLHTLLWPTEPVPKNANTSAEEVDIPAKIKESFEALLSSHGVFQNFNSSLKNGFVEKLNLFISSFQHQEVNKCLLFHMFDVIVETACMEI